jgi:hypothetical protein
VEETIMNPFTVHPRQQGVTYSAHLRFAMGIAWRLLSSVAAFVVHAVLPFVPIAPRLDLEATTAFLAERNRWIETAKVEVDAGARPDPAFVEQTCAIRGLTVG